VLQSVNNFGLGDMERVVNILNKERFDVVALSLPPLNDDGESLLYDSADVEKELELYSNQAKRYKKGDIERVVYERVNNLRQANINLSVLYQVARGGTLENHPTCLMLPSF